LNCCSATAAALGHRDAPDASSNVTNWPDAERTSSEYSSQCSCKPIRTSAAGTCLSVAPSLVRISATITAA
jgi:hypothetical protein